MFTHGPPQPQFHDLTLIHGVGTLVMLRRMVIGSDSRVYRGFGHVSHPSPLPRPMRYLTACSWHKHAQREHPIVVFPTSTEAFIRYWFGFVVRQLGISVCETQQRLVAQNRAFCPQQIHDDSAWYEHMVRTSASVPEDVWNAPPFADNPAVEKRDIPSVAELTATCRDFPHGFRPPRDGEDDPDGGGPAAPGALGGAVIGTVI